MGIEKKFFLKEEVADFDLPFILWELCQNAYKDGSPWTKKQFLADVNLENSHYLILKEKDQYAGFVSYHHVLDEAEVTHVVVNRSFQKKGYGKQLLRELNESLRQKNVQQVFLEVRCSNQAAKKLYQKHGFKEIATRKNYYSHPKEDAVVMCLTIRK